MALEITASIVLFNTNPSEIKKSISNLIVDFPILKLYLIDNSPNDQLKIICRDEKVEYIHNPSNPGFGAAHNIAIKNAIKMGAKYHFVINPDVFFDGNVIKAMVAEMEKDDLVGMIMPQVLNLDGSNQYLPKLLPTPFSILLRKLKKPKAVYNKYIDRYELRSVPKDKIYNAPILSGCFTLLKLKAIGKVGMYDDKFFMYFEDWDLSRRVHQFYKTLYFPKVCVYHGYESGANKSLRLFKIFVQSAVYYFNKWGWFFDKERKKINSATLAQFK